MRCPAVQKFIPLHALCVASEIITHLTIAVIDNVINTNKNNNNSNNNNNSVENYNGIQT